MPRIDIGVCNIWGPVCGAAAAAAFVGMKRALISRVGDPTLKQAGR